VEVLGPFGPLVSKAYTIALLKKICYKATPFVFVLNLPHLLARERWNPRRRARSSWAFCLEGPNHMGDANRYNRVSYY